jgi:hypothetical protein
MTQIIPPRFLFRWAFRAPYCAELGMSQGECRPIPEACRLPDLDGFDAERGFANFYCGWNERGLAFGYEVRGKRKPVEWDNLSLHKRDECSLWLDTRCTQTVHRATKYCHAFTLQAASAHGGPPKVVQGNLPNAREERPLDPKAKFGITRVDVKEGFRLQVWFPGETLYGFDPQNHQRLGFYAVVRDRERGEQPLTVGPDFPYHYDPSQWQTLELVT